MSSSTIDLASIKNQKAGLTALAVISGTPVGTLSFVGSRTPNVSTAAPINAVAGVNVGEWVVTTPTMNLWYVWAVDDNGPTNSPGAVWVGLSDDPDADLTGQWLAARFTEHMPGINAALQTWWPDTTLKGAAYGSVLAVTDFPFLLITKPRVTRAWMGFPMLAEFTYQFEIDLICQHTEPMVQLPLAAKMVDRLMEIINMPDYVSFQLGSGLSLAFCGAQEGEADEYQDDDNQWVAIATMVWTGKGLKQDTGGVMSIG